MKREISKISKSVFINSRIAKIYLKYGLKKQEINALKYINCLCYMYRYGFQPSSTLPAKFLMNVICDGFLGEDLRNILASSGVLLPFLLLHLTQAVTRFSQISSPPRDFGITWSTVRFTTEPQYWHL